MTAKTFFQKLGSKYIWLNIGLMAIVAIAFVTAVSVGTDLYTHHGEAIKVPNLQGKKFEDAQQLIKNSGLIIMVSDTGYNRMLPPDCILQQTPEAGEPVKSGRCVFVTVNASQKPTLILPDIVDNSSLREATAKLKILGFKVGAPQYISGEKDWVYGVVARGKSLSAGDRVPLDMMVSLQVGNGMLDHEEEIIVTDPEYEEEEQEEAVGVIEEDPFEEIVE
ncbi:MAG: PASTA domain-containing protein [Bacteroidales bacterium]|nr:PASTA domain-containing protein [Bacteroidales bacterium]MCM1147741.1 PASTA domain-containing protein [Bacteroidales bacterium]MCM1206649.1 PASTA domain-containing protein [Bacillota bacterium]MCM1510610.1 PASTA domain-containing protein [Clostridium sp.]